MRFTLRHLLVLISSIVIIAILTFLSLQFVPVTRAGVYHLYATSCLGGWENPHLASGMPELKSKDDAIMFTVNNSAKLNANIHSQIYCGGFTGDILEETIPKKITVRFSWAVKRFFQTPTEIEIIIPESPESEEVITPEEETIVDENSAIVVGEIMSNIINRANEPQKDSQEVMNNLIIGRYVANSSIAENFAVQTINENTQNKDLMFVENNPISTTTEAVINESIITDSMVIEKETLSSEKEEKIELKSESASEIENSVFLTPSIVSPTAQTPHGFLEVLYTLDGVDWKSLGFVQEDLFRDLSFEIPIEEASDWEDVSKIQIGIRSVPVLDGVPLIVYLDSVWIEVEYRGSVEDPFTPPKGKEGDIILSETSYENMIAVLVSRKSKNPTESPKKELWLASISYLASNLNDTSISATTSVFAPRQVSTKKEWKMVADDFILSENPRIIFEDNNIFWVGKGDATLWSFNTQTNGYSSVSLSEGESARLYFKDEAGEERAIETASDIIETLLIIDIPVEENLNALNY